MVVATPVVVAKMERGTVRVMATVAESAGALCDSSWEVSEVALACHLVEEDLQELWDRWWQDPTRPT